MLRIGDWVEREYIQVYTRGLETDPFDRLASHPGRFESLNKLIFITLDLDTRYHERQKKKGSHQEEKPPVTESNSSRPPQYPSSKKPCHKKSKKGNNFQVLKYKPHYSLLNKDNKLIGSEKERRMNEGLCTHCGGKHPIQNFSKVPHNRPGPSRGFPSK
ncbi:hypothetical protein O181_025438 [Austropuccinia psidii MF-1]|uniref:Uncharacterized protein n=1 Tax=Austropuccinia psidii MF-1 TaxID=1389203 RepID=A0A9Q3GZ41_9BASI|nr:hypothetical protein [Austropuccinia psidii MF-1]